MTGAADHGEPIAGYFAPVHRALTEPILLGGAPRSLAIVNGTLAGAIGLGLRLWIAGLAIWAIGHALSVWAARRDPQFVDVARRHLGVADVGLGASDRHAAIDGANERAGLDRIAKASARAVSLDCALNR